MYNKKAVKCYEEGRVLQQDGRLSVAERAYKKAIKINPDFYEAHTNLGNVLLDRKRFDGANDAYRRALKLLPDHPMLLSNIGNLLQLQGENEKAIGWFNKAIIQDPRYTDAHSNLGNALRDLGRLEEAVAVYIEPIPTTLHRLPREDERSRSPSASSSTWGYWDFSSTTISLPTHWPIPFSGSAWKSMWVPLD